MKRCPYCAEEIQDAAVKCRWCGSDLTLPPDKVVAKPPEDMATAPSGEPAQARPPATTPSATPSVAAPSAAQSPTATTPTSGPPIARPAATEPAAAPGPDTPQPATSSSAAAPAARAPEILSPPRTPSPNPGLTFSHEGPRFLLGYTQQYYGIWDKGSPGPPVERFPRTDQGWQQAWEAFIRREMGTV